ncbi:MAG: amidohydrolase family protein [Methylophilaceae bacterium]|jgi:5-methylthioadenosine/S-adenosylhomocysteine deaminase|nr:amidohydrolase family protein [Methylophilaceae bacterium]NCV27377.1 TRZ/ATZ family hydrolase [Nitrosomonadales bacterium]
MSDISNNHFGIHAKWIYTANSKQELLEDHIILIKNDLIEEIVPFSDFSNNEDLNILNLGESLITPGLINAHTHSAMTFLKGISDDQRLNDWLEKSIWPNEEKLLSNDLVYDASQLACLEMLSSGITTFNDMYFFPDATAKAATVVGIRANIGLVFIEFKSSYANDFTDYLDKGLKFRDDFRGEENVTTTLAPHAPYTVSDDSFLKIRTYADQLGMNIHCHMHETEWEIINSIEQHNVRPLTRLDSLGLLGPDFIAVHCVHLSSSDIEIIKKNQINIVTCPVSNLKLASGMPKINTMLNAAQNVSIGSDGSASNNKLGLFDDLKLFALLQRNEAGVTEFTNSKNLFDMVTINAAKTLNMQDQIGSIEKNKKADLVAFNLSDIHLQPIYDPLSTIIYSGGRDNVEHVWVNGDLKFSETEFINDIDVETSINKIKLWKNKIST